MPVDEQSIYELGDDQATYATPRVVQSLANLIIHSEDLAYLETGSLDLYRRTSTIQ